MKMTEIFIPSTDADRSPLKLCLNEAGERIKTQIPIMVSKMHSIISLNRDGYGFQNDLHARTTITQQSVLRASFGLALHPLSTF